MEVRKTSNGKAFYCADCAYEQRDVPKAAGFYFYWGPKNGNHLAKQAQDAGVPEKHWWTPYLSKAALLSEHAVGEAKAEIDAHNESYENSRSYDADIDIPSPEGMEYRGFQRAGIQYALARPHTLIADEMGLGKTISALGFVNALGEEAKRRLDVLVICPASLKLNWAKEAEKWLLGDFKTKVVKNGRDLPTDDDNLVICNFDLTFRRDITRRRARKGVPAETPEEFATRLKAYNEEVFFCDKIAERKWDVVIIDEGHFLKNEKAKRTIAILGKRKTRKEDAQQGIVHNAERNLILTGTPIQNRPIEIFPLLNALYPEEFSSYWTFAKRYNGAYQDMVPVRGRGMVPVWKLGSPSNLDELQRHIRSVCVVRRLKSEVLTELPPKVRQIISIRDEDSDLLKENTPEMENYRRYVEGLIKAADKTSSFEKAQNAYKSYADDNMEHHEIDITKVSKIRVGMAKRKLPYVVEHLESMISEGVNKVIVFAVHHEVIDRLMKEFGDRAVKIDGRDSQDKRNTSVERFQNDESVQFFIGQIHAAGVGLTLTAASNVVFVELDWVPANLTQGEDRAHRIGQQNFVQVQHLVLEGSLDEHFVKMIIEKQEVFDTMLDEKHAAPEIPELAELEDESPQEPTYSTDTVSYASATAEQREAAKNAMRHLESLGVDGFQGFDSKMGLRLAQQTEVFDDSQVALATMLIRRYRNRMSIEHLEPFGIE